MTFLKAYIQPFPSHAFAGLLGDMISCLAGTGVAAEIVGIQLIAFASLLTQGIADVVWPNGQFLSIGASCLLVARSGSGKSLIFRLLIEAIEAYLNERSQNNNSNRLDFLIEDATREAIVQSLHDWPVAGLFTDEAGQLHGLFKDSPTLVKLLDGAPLRSARISTGRVELVGQRLSMLLLEQPSVFETTKVKMGASKGGVGLVNRFFVAQSNDVGTSGSLHQVALSDSVKNAYRKKVTTLLDASINHVEKKLIDRPTVHLSVEATQYLVSLENEVRVNRALGSPLFFISEYLSRHVERTLRLAGVFHVFEHGAVGQISLDTIQRAAILGQWFIESYAQMVFTPPKLTQVEVDASELERAIFQAFYSSGVFRFRQSEMRACALNLGLTPNRFSRALAVLGGQQKIRVVMQRATPWIELNTFQLLQYR